MNNHKLKISTEVKGTFTIYIDICYRCGRLYDWIYDGKRLCPNCNTYSIQTVTMGYDIFENMFEPEIVNNEILGKYIPI